MPALKNGQWERYARARAQGATMAESARQAGYAEKTLRMAYQVDRRPVVQERIRELQGRIEEGIVNAQAAPAVTVARVLEEYGHIAFLDPAQAWDENGNLLPIHKMPEHVRRAIAGIEYESREKVGRLAKLKFVDKKGALDSIAKYLGMFIERQQMLDRNGKPMDAPNVTVQFVKVDAATATSSVSGQAVISLPAG